MEVLGIASSIIAVVQIAGTVTSLGYGYISGVKRASNDIHELMRELTSLSQVLVALQDYTDTCAPGSTVLQTLEAQLRECTIELKTLESKLRRGMRNRWWEALSSLKWPLKGTETSQFMERIERHKGLFMIALNTDHISLSKSIEGQVKAVEYSVKGLQEQLHVTSETHSSRRLKEDIAYAKQKRKEVINWIYSGEFDTKHVDISSKRQPDTGKWLLESPEMQDWASETPTFNLAWGYGIPGAGKTFLCSGAIDHFQNQSQTSGYGVAYFYFDYKEESQQTPVLVLASLVKQLACQASQLSPQIEALYDRLEQKGKRPNLEELFITLISVFKSFNRVFVIFDALDECNQESRKKLLPLFHRMGVCGASLFITSRHYPEDIQESFRGVPKIELSATGQDIRSYILGRLEENPRAKRLARQGGCEERIISELTECAKGMFLLVHFHIEHICQQTTAKQILAALETLKSSSTGEYPLDPTYDRVLDSIRQQPKTCAELAIKILSWLVKARRALTVQEIQIAVSIYPGQYRLDDLDLTHKATLLEVCAGLVIIDESNTIRLTHLTIQEYLLRRSVIPQEADYNIAIACISYLSFEIFSETCETKESLDVRLDSNLFLEYAAYHMPYHLGYCDEAISADLILGFLGCSSKVAAWVLANMYLRFDRDLDGRFFASLTKEHLPLHMASYIGNYLVVQRLLEGGANALSLDGSGRTAVQWASWSGQEAILKLLVEHGAIDVSHQDEFGWTALHCAADEGHEIVVRLLISEMGADASISDEKGYTPLIIAATGGHEAVVKLLLANGIDASTPIDDGSTPLHLAAQNGHEAVVKLLLVDGVDASATCKDGYTPLHWATQNGHEVVVKLLLANGVDASATCKDGYTPLHWAAQTGHEVVVKLLLANGVDVSATDKGGCTPLCLAALCGHEAVVKLFLENGIDASTPIDDGSTPLHLAAQNGHEVVVKLLLANGVDASATCKDGYTPLHWAAQTGHEVVVKLLLANGVDASATCKDGYTPLHWAAQNGHEVVVKLLLANGVDASATCKDGYTPLHWAAQNGHEVVVKLLLANGVDASATDKDGYTPLCLAALCGHEAVVKLFLANGIDASTPIDDGSTPLHLAAQNGHEVVVKLLLANGVDASATCKDGYTPLHWAAQNGHEVVVKLLLANGVDASATDKDGYTPLHCAAQNGHDVVVKLLLANGVDASAMGKDGYTPLCLAALCGHEAVVKLFLANGIDASTPIDDGSTPLHLAAQNGHEVVVKLLLANGVDASATCKDGYTPLHWAAQNGHGVVSKLLLSNSVDTSIMDKFGYTPLRRAELGGHGEVAKLLRKSQDRGGNTVP